MELKTKLFIDGKWKDSTNKETFKVYDPSNNSVIGEVALGTRNDILEAIECAEKSFISGAWSGLTIFERSKILHQVAELIGKYSNELAEIESKDVGKPIFESANIDIPSGAQTFEYFADLAVDICGETIPSPYNEVIDYTIREPLGVVGMIIPWNFPFLIACRKLATALAAGNTVVIKPASWAPLSTMMLGEIFKEAGLPDGVVNIVPGKGDIVGTTLCEAPRVHEISFTGSTEIGHLVMSSCVRTLKGCGLELGGKSPALVLPDCNMEETIDGILFGVYLSQGECCCAATRLIIHEKVYDEFVERFVEGSKNIKMGMPLDKDTRMGPLVDKKHLEKVLGYIEIGKKEGGKILCGGQRLKESPFDKGNFLSPTVFVNVGSKSRIAQKEIFGPVAVILKVSSEEEMIKLANDTSYGLAASIWTRDIKTGHRLAAKIQAGTVWINLHNFVFPSGPYGGYKDSGIGRELGREGLLSLTQTKNVMIGLFEPGFKWY